MPLRIAFDLDGVLADMDAALIHHAEALFGESITRRFEERAVDTEPATPPDATAAEDPTDEVENAPPLVKLAMSARQHRRLWRHVQSVDNFWETLSEIEPGVIERLATIAAERRWEVIFLTKRPETTGLTAQVQSQRWLESNGFRLPSVYVVQGSRGRIAASLHLDIVVDDRPENCLDVVVDSKARAILVWRDDEKLLPAGARRLGIGVVKTVGDCLDILTQVDSPDRDQPGVRERLLRLFGLNKPAKVPS